MKLTPKEKEEMAKHCTVVKLENHKRQPRKRFRLTDEQTAILMRAFEKTVRPDKSQRIKLARLIPGTTERSIQVWFQNKRSKMFQRSDQASSPNSFINTSTSYNVQEPRLFKKLMIFKPYQFKMYQKKPTQVIKENSKKLESQVKVKVVSNPPTPSPSPSPSLLPPPSSSAFTSSAPQLPAFFSQNRDQTQKAFQPVRPIPISTSVNSNLFSNKSTNHPTPSSFPYGFSPLPVTTPPTNFQYHQPQAQPQHPFYFNGFQNHQEEQQNYNYNQPTMLNGNQSFMAPATFYNNGQNQEKKKEKLKFYDMDSQNMRKQKKQKQEKQEKQEKQSKKQQKQEQSHIQQFQPQIPQLEVVQPEQKKQKRQNQQLHSQSQQPQPQQIHPHFHQFLDSPNSDSSVTTPPIKFQFGLPLPTNPIQQSGSLSSMFMVKAPIPPIKKEKKEKKKGSFKFVNEKPGEPKKRRRKVSQPLLSEDDKPVEKVMKISFLTD